MLHQTCVNLNERWKMAPLGQRGGNSAKTRDNSVVFGVHDAAVALVTRGGVTRIEDRKEKADFHVVDGRAR